MKGTIMKKILFVLILFFSNLFAGDNLTGLTKSFNAGQLVGKEKPFQLGYNQKKFELLQDVKAQTKQELAKESKRKSSFKAVMFSAVLPGAGQYYTESYWKSALFAVVEIAAWSGYFVYNDKGKTRDREMKRFGDANWSEQYYWSRIYDKAVEKGNWDRAELNPDANGIVPQSEIDGAIDRLRYLETNGGYPRFTHTLPSTKTQQYYEMIYKYLGQFGSGWTELDDWTYYDFNPETIALTPDVKKYKHLRNTSNDFYSTATSMTRIILINHLASAIDAAFSTKGYNAGLSYSIYADQKLYAGERVDTYGLALSW